MVSLGRKRSHGLKRWRNVTLRLFKIEACLQTHPESGAGTKRPCKPQRGVSRDATLAQYDFIDAPGRHVHCARQRVLADRHGQQKLFEQHFARVNVAQSSCHQILASVVIDYLNATRIAINPAETNAPLAVDANAVLALALILQRFQPVGGRYSQVIQSLRRIEHPQLAPCHILDRGGKPARTVSVPDLDRKSVV